MAHIIANGREQGGILGQDERQQSLRSTWMRADTLYFSSDMLRIARTGFVKLLAILPSP